jgi:hypothetical protein
MTPRRLSTLPLLLVAGLALAGCVATPAPTSTPSASPTASLSDSPTAEPSAAPAAGCDTVLTADGYAKLTSLGFDPLEPPATDHLATYYPFAAQMVEAGGLSCHWGKPQSDAGITITQISGADMSVWQPALTAAGFVETNDPVPGAYTGPVDPGTGTSPVVVVTGDTLTFVDNSMFTSWIAPTT